MEAKKGRGRTGWGKGNEKKTKRKKRNSSGATDGHCLETRDRVIFLPLFLFFSSRRAHSAAIRIIYFSPTSAKEHTVETPREELLSFPFTSRKADLRPAYLSLISTGPRPSLLSDYHGKMVLEYGV